MGVKNLFKVIKSNTKYPIQLNIKDLKNKIILIDASNIIYKSKTSINFKNNKDYYLFKDKSGALTSHLSIMIYKTLNFLENNIKPVWIFDGIASNLKNDEVILIVK